MSESFAQLLEESFAKTEMRPGAMLIGTVIDIENEFVIVSTQAKSEGVIPKWQFLNADGDLEVNIAACCRQLCGRVDQPSSQRYWPNVSETLRR